MIHIALKSFLILFLFFLSHRVGTFSFLSNALSDTETLHYFQAFLVGVMSDLWTAILGSLLIVFIEFLLIITRFRRFCSCFRNGFLLIMLLIVSFHHNYVAFFQFPVIPLHLSYISDPVFVRGNMVSVVSLGTILTLAAGALFWWLVHRFIQPKTLNKKFTTGLYLCAILGSLAGHVLHIRYKVQWFIPDSLQYNFIEGLVIKAGQSHKAAPLTDQELKTLLTHYSDSEVRLGTNDSVLKGVHLRSEPLQKKELYDPVLFEIKAKVEKTVAGSRKPLLITYLMESFRYVDSGVYGQETDSLTPEFDRLAMSGFLFENAWSVSQVTRGGQEAVWCGYQSAQGRSAMKERTELPLRCLTDESADSQSFWIHGGDGRFDHQQWFWTSHGVGHTMSLSDFPSGVAATGWGLGDYSLAPVAAETIKNLHDRTSKKHLFGMVMTITNHIPWDVPDDAGELMARRQFSGIHPSERTVYYADLALGRFVDELKKRQLWDQTILVIVGDHGIKAPPLNPAFTDISPGEQASHIGLLLSGGLVEQVRKLNNQSDHRRTEMVSQADIASFWAVLLGLEDFESMGESLFKYERLRPVFADLGQQVYFPRSGESKDVRALIQGTPDSGKNPEWLFYQSFIQWLDLWSVRSD